MRSPRAVSFQRARRVARSRGPVIRFPTFRRGTSRPSRTTATATSSLRNRRRRAGLIVVCPMHPIGSERVMTEKPRTWMRDRLDNGQNGFVLSSTSFPRALSRASILRRPHCLRVLVKEQVRCQSRFAASRLPTPISKTMMLFETEIKHGRVHRRKLFHRMRLTPAPANRHG